MIQVLKIHIIYTLIFPPKIIKLSLNEKTKIQKAILEEFLLPHNMHHAQKNSPPSGSNNEYDRRYNLKACFS
ncbi:hypothetical protein HanRHA438_Chr05g0223091 [Helianthus annuus]|nr:hypothetical protein HanRHA438_Chr05g0223091 [Helianthus annuus]